MFPKDRLKKLDSTAAKLLAINGKKPQLSALVDEFVGIVFIKKLADHDLLTTIL